MISRICEEFHCTPEEALDQPYDLALTIMQLRAYAHTKQTVEAAKRQSDVPETVLTRKYQAIKLEIMADAKAQRRV